ncbi:hypothetical protein RJ40_01440 [Methanofollis aquaemaris]|uniref:CHAT domain-containing protein n=1 Tax=Methanofollis aquaemaris TaxID=126734 RepID=A0A8A3S3S4_9EURY|nr:hypothetical protein [Methanofollis aquaemaris]QSZ66254.1 hypothetical protein RJ40_01440 [Methanofollis aquaemaris]
MEEKWRIDNRSLMLGMLVLCTLIVLSPVFESASAYRASNYAVSDGIDTYSFIEHAAQKQASMGYSTSKYKDRRADFAFNRLPDDQVFYFSGHGGPGQIQFGTTRIFATTGQNSISDFTSGELNDLALAVFVACKSGATESTYGNLLTESTSNGVDCAVGFEKEIKVNTAECWSDHFWDLLDEGKTVENAAGRAVFDTQIRFVAYTGGVESYIIKGNSNLRIDPATAGV